MLKENLSDFFIGQTANMERTFTKEDVKKYIELTRDDNYIYTNDEFAGYTQLKKTIVPGLLNEGLIMEVITNKFQDTPSAMLQKEILYTHPVYIGDTITAKVEIIDIDFKRNWATMMLSCTNQNGKNVITGQMVVLYTNKKIE